MTRNLQNLTLAAVLVSAMVSANCAAEPPAQAASLKIVVIGDSTVCDYPNSQPTRGWGQYLQGYFKDSVKVINLARSGRSTKTFIKEGRWKAALAERPDFVLIQFGHNDSHGSQRPESTDAATTYKDFLRQYIDESRAVHAKPILITPMCRRTFDAQGELQDILQPYADAMKQVAAEEKVAVIDLHSSSHALFEKLGPAECEALANKAGDRTHFNEKGAKAMAELVMKELPRVEPLLAREITRSKP